MNARNGVLLGLFFLLAASCTERNPFASGENISSPEALQSSRTYGATLLECPAGETRSASRTIGPLGGVLEVGPHRLLVPARAVLTPTTFTMTVPASNYVEVSVTAEGSEHYRFEHPVELTISYERCTRSDIDRKKLRIFFIDPATKQILEDLGGVDDKELRQVTTSTDHLSGYSVGDN